MTAPGAPRVARMELNPAALALHSEGVDRHRQVVGELVALLEWASEDGLTEHTRDRLRSYASRVEATASACAATLRALAAEPMPSPCVYPQAVILSNRNPCAFNFVADLAGEHCRKGAHGVTGPGIRDGFSADDSNAIGVGVVACTSKWSNHRCTTVHA